METQIFIQTFEATVDEGKITTLTPQNLDMNCLIKILQERMKKDILKDVLSPINHLEQSIKELTQRVNEHSKTIASIKESTDILITEHNKRQGHSHKKSTDAINKLYEINDLFKNYLSDFGNAHKLNILQLLVEYLYQPSDDIYRKIIDESQRSERKIADIVEKILNEIDEFNNSLRTHLITDQQSQGIKWSDCVYFPERKLYDPCKMEVSNGADIAKGNPVYVVSIGLDFRNSNSEKQKTRVFPRNYTS